MDKFLTSGSLCVLKWLQQWTTVFTGKIETLGKGAKQVWGIRDKFRYVTKDRTKQ